MNAIALEEVGDRLADVIETLGPGEEAILTRGNKPVARVVGLPPETQRPLPGRGKGMLTIVSEDDNLKDWEESMP